MLFLFILNLYIHCVSGCLLYPINFKTVEPIRPKFFVGPQMTPEKDPIKAFSIIETAFMTSHLENSLKPTRGCNTACST